MQKDKRREKNAADGRELSTSFTAGAVAIIFLIIGYQMALFIHRAKGLATKEGRIQTDTVYVIDKSLADKILDDAGLSDDPSLEAVVRQGIPVRKKASKHVDKQILPESKRRFESFCFNPNTVSVEDLKRLGFSQKQAISIDNYRKKGGRFRRKEDFARSYVVSDSVYCRLEQYINIPKLDINLADSAAFDELPGIGGYFASAILRYRKRLGGSFSYKEQLLDIPKFSRDRFDGISDLIEVRQSGVRPYGLWVLPEDSLRIHPYIGKYAAHGIVLYRENNPPDLWTVNDMVKAGILTEQNGEKLKRCVIQSPESPGR